MGYLVVASIGAVAVVGAIIVFFLLAAGSSGAPSRDEIAPDGQPPHLVLVVLNGSEVFSKSVGQYDPSSDQIIPLHSNAYVRFDSLDFRTAEGMRVLAEGDDGGIEVLRKSYYANNGFFINLDKGSYELQVQASWGDRGTYLYVFNISVT
ncbi:MAG: hypothetical protein MN733_34575 [Nitrososphaera sp.]|nr:hypothetical protein [Nitrososphaera sp.]